MSENNPETVHENGQLSPIKTEENDKICWSPRFEFDAPRYANFSSNKFRETRRLLNKLVLNQDDDSSEDSKESRINDNNTAITTDFNSDSDGFEDLISFDSDSSDIDEWFNRFHPLHEPLRPMTPPGPLISPEKLFVFRPQPLNLKASPLKLNSADANSPKLSAVNCDLNTPSKGPNTRIGLRSKPARVLKSNNNLSNSSFNSSPSSLVRSNFSNNQNSNNSSDNPLSSPTRRNLVNSPVRSNILSSPIRTNQNNMALLSSPFKNISRLSSPIRQQQQQSTLTPSRLSSTSNASSMTLSVSSLTKTFYNEQMSIVSSPTRQTNCDFDTNSPLKMKTKFSEGISSPLRKAVGILQLEEEESKNQNNNLKKRLTSTNETILTKKHRPAKIDAELEDIKKLLSQHNNRIRPSNKKKS